jgi:hypothetical protein
MLSQLIDIKSPPPPTQYVIPPNMIMYTQGCTITIFICAHLLLAFFSFLTSCKEILTRKKAFYFNFVYSTVFLLLFFLANIEYII